MATAFAPTDLDHAVALYNANPTPIASAFLDLLIDNPGERFDSEVVQQRLGIEDHRDIARTTYQLGVLAGAMNRQRPWGEAQRGYAMTPEMADLFRDARAKTTAS